VLLSVEERKPQAQWGETGILSTEGVIFYPPKASIPAKLPRFSGPDPQAKEMLEKYLKILEIIAPLGLRVCALDLSHQGEWRLRLDNGLSLIVGRADFETRINRFKIAYQNNLHAKSQNIAYIDLRYTNGLAVGWKEVHVD
jgi:cell division protein FtsQ